MCGVFLHEDNDIGEETRLNWQEAFVDNVFMQLC